METLGVIGFLGFIAGIIMLIVSAIRRKRKRIWGIVAGTGIVAFILGMSLSGSPSAPQAPAPQASLLPTPTLQPSTSSLTPQPTSTANLITKDASVLMLDMTDFPVGWTLLKEDTVAGYYKRYFLRSKYGLQTVLSAAVKVFPTIDEAQKEYTGGLDSVRVKYSIANPRIGQESFAYDETGRGFFCQFRELNVVGQTQMPTTLFGGGSLDDTISWARKLDAKIIKLTK